MYNNLRKTEAAARPKKNHFHTQKASPDALQSKLEGTYTI